MQRSDDSAPRRSRRLTGPFYVFRGQRLHYRDALVIETTPQALGLARDAERAAVKARLLRLFEGRVSPCRVALAKVAPANVLAIVLEWQPDVHAADEDALETIERRHGGEIAFRGRSRTIPLAAKNETIIEVAGSGLEPRAEAAAPRCRRLVFHFSKIETGLGDRLVGLASALVLARALGAEVFLDRPAMPEVFDTKTAPDALPERFALNWIDSQHAHTAILRESDFLGLGETAHVVGNECFHAALYGNAHVRGRLGAFEADLRAAYREIFATVLKPKDAVRSAVDALLAGAAGRRVIGLQLRSGWIKDETPVLSEDDVRRICRRLVAAFDARSDTIVFVTADNNDIAALARATLEALGVATLAYEAPVLHISYPEHQSDARARMKLVVDLLALARCDALCISLSSNFGRIAHYLGRATLTLGFYSRNFDFIESDGYQFSSKHLLFNDAVMSGVGGVLRFRYLDEYGARAKTSLFARGALRWVGATGAQAIRSRAIPKLSLPLLIRSIYAAERPSA